MITKDETPEKRVTTIVTLDFPTPDAAEFLGGLGCDALAVDLEHGNLSTGDLSDLARACTVAGVSLIGRVRCHEESVSRCLDAGITILELTHVMCPADIERVIGWAAFAPAGRRGIGRARANSFGHHPGGYPAFVENVNTRGIDLLVHVETVEALSAIKEIAAFSWVKALIIGAHDLAASAGHPGDPAHPRARELVEEAMIAIADSDALLGLSASSYDDARSAAERGAGVVLVSQARLLSQALASVISGAGGEIR